MKRTQLFTLAGLMIASSGYASATTISFQGLDAALSTSVWLDFTYMAGDTMLNGNTANRQRTVTESIGVGALDISVDGSLQLQDAFCVDPFRYISNGNYTVNLAGPSAVTNGSRAAWMVHDILPQISASTNANLARNMAAALQLAIWDVVTDNGDGFGRGRIQASSNTSKPTDAAILSLANSFISQSVGQSSANAYIISNVNLQFNTQRLIIDRPGSAVPEPSTWALALSGLAFAAFRRVKRF